MTIAKVYGPALGSLVAGDIDFAGATVKCALTNATYSPNQDTHEFFDDVTNEVSGSGYTAGGVTLTGKTATYNTSTNTLTLDSSDPTWAALSVPEIRYAVFYVSTGVASTSPLISYMDFESNTAPGGASVTIVLPATGIVTFTVG